MIRKYTMCLNTFLIAALLCACSGKQSSATEQQSTPMESIDSLTEEITPKEYTIPSGTIYEKQDSITIEKLLQDAKSLKKDENRMLFFGKSFIGIPYVAHTLEKGEKEVLVVNTRELDCTTFVETCAALTLADQKDIRTFAGFCQLLSQLRYRQGILDGYTSRLHYSTQWISDNEAMGFFKEITHEGAPFVATQTIDIHYMSKNPDKYSKLVGHPKDVKTIKQQEDQENGKEVRYIPKRLLNGSVKELSDVQDGDILALVTSMDGLDNSHLGIAIWQNGKLHLLNASSLHKAVWIDPATLYNYSQPKKSNLGIRVIRVL